MTSDPRYIIIAKGSKALADELDLSPKEVQIRTRIIEFYWEEEMSLREIQEALGVSSTYLRRLFYHFLIPLRTTAEAIKVAARKRRHKVSGGLLQPSCSVES